MELSKSGPTVYFNDSALKKIKSPGIGANHYNIETGDEYWISGIKKNGLDRHWAGSGKVMIDKDIVEKYLKHICCTKLDITKYEVISINKDFDKSRFNKIENQKCRVPDYSELEFYQ